MPFNITPKEGFLYYQSDNGEWNKMGNISDIDITEEGNNIIEPLPFINLNRSFTITLYPPEIMDAEAVKEI